ncbi:(5-formylfuran-3-yl)methyl phosphate synthase [Propylenella binzhouense]|uniref:(5-formylfuran-3-yl)methyl phosphate synthase n=1 Tax=Propylenella binzhouense TaxID=2555902 RepID=A0A964T3S4_9HYPH|nr:(5-formylfuran-3-yl)methyl phosphate synthase [Propylenella binzhouense]MYZ47007.1 FolB domain-containing protein [Propylenella binzhouense]
MTLMLASVADAREAEIAISIGTDIVDAENPAGGAVSPLPPDVTAAVAAAARGRARLSAAVGEIGSDPGAIAAAADRCSGLAIEIIRVGFASASAPMPLVGAVAGRHPGLAFVAVLFADRMPGGDPLPLLAEAGFRGVMLDVADKTRGRVLELGIPRIAAFVEAAKGRGLMVGLAGNLEPADIPRLLPLEADFLGFRAALCPNADRRAPIDPAAAAEVRRLIPAAAPRRSGPGGEAGIRAAPGPGRRAGIEAVADRIFVRDLILPVRIGVYRRERDAPQRVRFDVSIDLAPRETEAEGLAGIMSYDVIVDTIRTIVAEGHVELAEELAEEIAARLLSDRRAMKITVRVEKLDLGPGGIGVEIERRRAS